MNRDQKAAAIAEIATHIEQSEAVFAVDYRGITVPQAAELRVRLRQADTTFRIVKNSLTERAARQAGADALEPLLEGPTALAFVRGDAAMAAKAIADYGRPTHILPFKGGMLGAESLHAEQIVAISRLPAREVLYGQLVGVVASPVTGLVRTLSALVGGLAIALGQLREKKESGEAPAGEAPAGAPESAEDAPEESAAQAPAAPESAEDAPAEESAAQPPAAPESAEDAPAEENAAQAHGDEDHQAEPAREQPAIDDNQADASAQAETAEATKED